MGTGLGSILYQHWHQHQHQHQIVQLFFYSNAGMPLAVTRRTKETVVQTEVILDENGTKMGILNQTRDIGRPGCTQLV